jgi:hypothetical protein
VIRSAAAVAALLAAGGCGYVGEPLPPALHIPEPVTDLTVHQRGEKLLIEFRLPSQTTEGLTLDEVAGLEIRGGPAPQGSFDAAAWEGGASSIEAPPERKGRLSVAIPAADWVGRDLVFGVRTVGAKGRVSQWSNFAQITVRAPLETPRSLRAEMAAQGVQLRWESPSREGVQFRVMRQKEGEQTAQQIGQTTAGEFLDTGAVYGIRHVYQVVAALEGPTGVLSELSPPVAIVPEDRFPPAAPTGLTVVAGTDSVELTWEPNREPDLQAYRVYRAVEASEWTIVADALGAPAFSDRGVMAGRRYRYSVTAIDEGGHESERAQPVEITLP